MILDCIIIIIFIHWDIIEVYFIVKQLQSCYENFFHNNSYYRICSIQSLTIGSPTTNCSMTITTNRCTMSICSISLSIQRCFDPLFLSIYCIPIHGIYCCPTDSWWIQPVQPLFIFVDIKVTTLESFRSLSIDCHAWKTLNIFG